MKVQRTQKGPYRKKKNRADILLVRSGASLVNKEVITLTLKKELWKLHPTKCFKILTDDEALWLEYFSYWLSKPCNKFP